MRLSEWAVGSGRGVLWLGWDCSGCGGAGVARRRQPASLNRRHRAHRRVEHGVPHQRGRRRGIPEGAAGRQGHGTHLRAPAAGSRSSAAASPTSPTPAGPSRPPRSRRAARRASRSANCPSPTTAWSSSSTRRTPGSTTSRSPSSRRSGRRKRRARSRSGARSAPDGRTANCTLFGAGVDSGTYDYFTEAINGKAGASRGDFTSSEDDNVLVQGVATDELGAGLLRHRLLRAERRAAEARADRRREGRQRQRAPSGPPSRP